MVSRIFVFLLLAVSVGVSTAAPARDKRMSDGTSWRQGDWKDKYWEGPCNVKIEYSRDEFRRNLKCEGGMLVVSPNDRPTIPAGASWRGEWEREFRDGPCLIKQEAKGDQFEEEVRCERRR